MEADEEAAIVSSSSGTSFDEEAIVVSSSSDEAQIISFSIPYFLYTTKRQITSFYYYIPKEYEFLFSIFEYNRNHRIERLKLTDERLCMLFSRLENRFLVIDTPDPELPNVATYKDIRIHFLTFYDSNPTMSITWLQPMLSAGQGRWIMNGLSSDDRTRINDFAYSLCIAEREILSNDTYNIHSDLSFFIMNTYASILNVRYHELYEAISASIR